MSQRDRVGSHYHRRAARGRIRRGGSPPRCLARTESAIMVADDVRCKGLLESYLARVPIPFETRGRFWSSHGGRLFNAAQPRHEGEAARSPSNDGRPVDSQTRSCTRPANYWHMPVAQRRAFEKGLKQPGDKACPSERGPLGLLRRRPSAALGLPLSRVPPLHRHVYEDCRLAPKITVAVLDVDSESKNGKQAEE